MQTPDTVYREFRTKLQSYLARRLRNSDDVEDVLQDVFVRVTRNAQTLKSVREPLAWLYTLTNSALVDHLRKQRNHVEVTDGDVENIPDLSERDTENDFSACLLPLVDNLPEKYQGAVKFVDMGGGKQTELAKSTGLTVSAAKSRVQRGRHMLKEAILGCCLVERDGLQNVTALDSGECGADCC